MRPRARARSQTHTHTYTQIHTQTQTCTHTNTHTYKHTRRYRPTDRQTNIHMHTHKHRQTDWQTNRQTDTNTHTYAHTNTQTDRQTHRHTETQMHCTILCSFHPPKKACNQSTKANGNWLSDRERIFKVCDHHPFSRRNRLKQQTVTWSTHWQLRGLGQWRPWVTVTSSTGNCRSQHHSRKKLAHVLLRRMEPCFTACRSDVVPTAPQVFRTSAWKSQLVLAASSSPARILGECSTIIPFLRFFFFFFFFFLLILRGY